MILIDRLQIDGEIIEVWQHGRNDFEVQYLTAGATYRGTLFDVMHDLHLCFGVFDGKL